MKVLTTSNTYMPLLCKVLGYTASPMALCIVCAEPDGTPIAGVIFDSFNGASIHCHIWIEVDRKPSREWLAVVFDYPFRQLGVKKLIGQVKSSNEEARRLDEHFGFVQEAEIKDYYECGSSLVVYTLTEEQSVILNSPRWAGVLDKIRGNGNGRQ